MRSAVERETQKASAAESPHEAGETQAAAAAGSLHSHTWDAPGRSETNELTARAEKHSGALAGFVSAGEWRSLLFLTLLSFLLRLFLVLRFEQVISPDGIVYVTLGRALVAGDFRAAFHAYWPPLYPLLVGLSSLVFRDVEFAGRFVSVVSGSLLVIVSHRLIRNWYGKRAALIGASLIALHPLLIYYSTTLLTESTYTLLFTSGILAGWSALSGAKLRANFLAGASFGACYLLKPEAAGFVLILLALTLGRKLFVSSTSLKTSARNALLLCAGFALLAAPYLLYLRGKTGAWTLSAKIQTHMWQGTRAAGDDINPARMSLVPDATTAAVQLTKALRSEYEIFNLIFPPAFVLLVGLGLFRRRWDGERALRELYLFSFVVAAFVGYAVTLPNIRFMVPLLPILLCWLSAGVIEFDGWAAGTLSRWNVARKFAPRVRKLIVPLVCAVLLASLLPMTIYLLRGDKWDDYGGQKRAAEWIKAHDSTPSPVIMATVSVAAFYAGGKHVALVDEDYAALIARARGKQVRYLVVNERNIKNTQLRSLLDGQSIHPGLRRVYELDEAPGHKILVYVLEDEAQDGP